VTAFQAQSDPTAVIGRRIGAAAVDWIIVIVVWGALFATMVDGMNAEGVDLCADVFSESDFFDDDFGTSSTSTQSDIQACSRDGALIIVSEGDSLILDQDDLNLIGLLTLGYEVLVFGLWQGLAGATPGKLLFGIRTVKDDGGAPGIGRALLRWVLWIVDALPYVCILPLVGIITASASKGHRRVGDMAAKTFVIDKSSFGQPVVVPGLTGPAATPQAWDPTGAIASPAAQPGGAGEPQWDAARNAYIRWDAATQTWTQFDDATQQWRSIQ
jgi:uncharacterized RDD family membrane protein YckC